MDQRILDSYNEYIHGNMPRREFFRRVTQIAGGAAAATALIALLEPNWAAGQQVAPTDERLEQTDIEYAGPSGKVRGVLVKPASASDRLPGVLVIHENRGLNAHIEDVARRAALAGYVALAPDGLSLAGGAPEDQEAARDLFGKTDREAITADVIAGAGALAKRAECNGVIGSVGFCYGGGVALRSAVEEPAVKAAVCFYGSALSDEQVAKLKVPVMMHYAGTDQRINAMIPEFRASLDTHQVAYSLHMYPGSGHGFHNDTSEARYDAAAAKLAWSRTIAFFDNYLR